MFWKNIVLSVLLIASFYFMFMTGVAVIKFVFSSGGFFDILKNAGVAILLQFIYFVSHYDFFD